MKKVQIYGERCSGTNYLEQLLLLNFDVEFFEVDNQRYGWKHFFGFNKFTESDDVLFIGIIRNLEDWINSLYRTPYHLPPGLTKNVNVFLTETCYSIKNDGTEIVRDRNMHTNEKYNNIFELRLVKNKFLIEDMQQLVKNYCLITYDELINNFAEIMNGFKSCGLTVKDGIQFPLNISYHVHKGSTFVKKPNEISKETIYEAMGENKELLYYEKLLFTY